MAGFLRGHIGMCQHHTDGFCCLDICFVHGTPNPEASLFCHCLGPQRVPHAQRTGLSPDLLRACQQWQSW